MQVGMLEVGPVGTNCYILIDEKTKVCAVIDPGDEAHLIAASVEKTGCKPCAIFLTYWMAYRKMWKPAILYCIILSIINGIIQGFGFGIQMICNLVLLLYYFFHMGYQGNILYWNFVKEELTKEGLADISQPNYPIREHLDKRGGTSILFLLAFILLSSMISSLLVG